MESNGKLNIWIALFLGTGIFFFFFSPKILIPWETDWCLNSKSDLLQHQWGSHALRTDEWHFPLCVTKKLNYPEGVSIVYTDSNPLLSLTAKVFKNTFKPDYQFWGLWYLLCWGLQLYFGYNLIQTLTKNEPLSLFGSLLFLLLPTLLFRIIFKGHSNLGAFWIITWSFFIYFNHDWSLNKKQILFWLLYLICLGIHAYFLPFVALLHIASITKNRPFFKPYKNSNWILINLVGVILAVLFCWVLGYFYYPAKHQGLNGYGWLSLRLDSIFHLRYAEYSSLLPSGSYDYTESEGFQFLGAGILFMSLCFVILYAIKEKVHRSKASLIAILTFGIMCIICTFQVIESDKILIIGLFLSFIWHFFILRYLYSWDKNIGLLLIYIILLLFSLTQVVRLGESTLFSFELSEKSPFIKPLQTFRSSGRFYWFHLTLNLVVMIKYLGEKFKFQEVSLGLFIIILFQLTDLSGISSRFGAGYDFKTPPNATLNTLMIGKKNLLFVGNSDENITGIALKKGITSSWFYTAHGLNPIIQKRVNDETEDFYHSRLHPNWLYLCDNLMSLRENVTHKIVFTETNYFTLNECTTCTNINEFNFLDLKLHPNFVLDSLTSENMESFGIFSAGNLNNKDINILNSIFEKARLKLPEFSKKTSFLMVFSQGKHKQIELSKNTNEGSIKSGKYLYTIKSDGEVVKLYLNKVYMNFWNKAGINGYFIDQHEILHLFHIE